MTAMAMYWRHRKESELLDFLGRMLASLLIGLMLLSLIYYAFPFLSVSRASMLFALLYSFVVISLIRLFHFNLSDHDIVKRRILVIGTGKKAKMLERHRGELDVISARLGELVKGMAGPGGILASLSAKEARIAAMIRNNLKSREIARELNISLDTIKTHRRNIRRKLGIQNDAINLSSYLKSNWSE